MNHVEFNGNGNGNDQGGVTSQSLWCHGMVTLVSRHGHAGVTGGHCGVTGRSRWCHGESVTLTLVSRHVTLLSRLHDSNVIFTVHSTICVTSHKVNFWCNFPRFII